MISATLEDGTDVYINHIVIEGSSQWTIGRNVTSKCDIIHSNRNYLQLPNHIQIPITDVDFHSFLPHSIFLRGNQQNYSNFRTKLFCATCNIPTSEHKIPWKDVKKIIGKVHKHVCGHATLSDVEVLLKRNNLWNDEIQIYSTRTPSSCIDCAKTYMPKQGRKVSLSSLNRSFNKLVCLDHFHLGDLRFCHIMDAITGYSVGAVVPDTSIKSAISVLDAHWISPFWAPNTIQYDIVFNNHEFKDFFSTFDIQTSPILQFDTTKKS